MPTNNYSGLWGSNYAPAEGDSPNNRQLFRWGKSNRKMRAIIDTLLGQAAGQTATVQHKQLPVRKDFTGPPVNPENRAIVNRVTTAADRTETRALFSTSSRIATPRNNAGNNWRA